jgi:hypothetical protein
MTERYKDHPLRDVFTWDSLRRMNKVNRSLACAAGDIEDFGVNILDAGTVSEKLKAYAGITIWKLRDICDFMCKLERQEADRARQFEKFLDEKIPMEEVAEAVDYQI